MITIVVRGNAKADSVENLGGLAKDLVKASRSEAGTVSYDFYAIPREVRVYRGLERSNRDRPPQCEPPSPGICGQGSTIICRSARHRSVSETHLSDRFQRRKTDTEIGAQFDSLSGLTADEIAIVEASVGRHAHQRPYCRRQTSGVTRAFGS